MPNFEPSTRLIEALESELRGRGFRLKHLARGVRRLSDLFVRAANTPPSERDPIGEYLLLPEQLAAYAAYYLPVNALKVRWVLEELSRYAPGFLSEPRTVLDFGSGPGSALLGLAETSRAAHRVTAVDRVAPALEMAAVLLRELTPFRVEIAPIPPPGKFDLIFAVNVLTELDAEREVDLLLEQLEPGGYFLLIEPAQKIPTGRVMALRDRLAEEGWKIAAPCLPVPSCPMRAHPELWCHMEVRWTRPGWIQRLDDRTGLDKEALKFSYLVATKEGAGLGGTARVVSHLHREKGKMWAWLCGGGADLCRAELLKRDLDEHNRDFRHARRGDVLDISEYAPAARTRLPGPARVKRL